MPASTLYRTLAVALLALVPLAALTACRGHARSHLVSTTERSVDHVGDGQEAEGRGDWEEARRQYETAMEISPRPAAQLGLARYYMMKGDHARALAYLEDVAAQLPHDRRVKILLAQARTGMEADQAVAMQEVLRDEAPVAARTPADPAPPAAPPGPPPAPRDLEPPVFTVESEPGLEAQEMARARPRESRPGATQSLLGTDESADPPKFVYPPEAVEMDGVMVLTETDPLISDRRTVGKALDAIENPLEPPPLPPADEVTAVLFGGAAALIESPDSIDAELAGSHADPATAFTADPEFYIERGREKLARGDADAARAEFVRALELQPNNPAALVELGIAYDDLGDAARARDLFVKASRLAPSNARVHFKMGNSYLRRGLPAQAIPHYDRALELDSDYYFARHNAAIALTDLGRWQEAEKLLIQVTDRNAGYAPAYRQLGIIAESFRNDRPLAVRYYKEYLKRGGTARAEVQRYIEELE